jgi:hypothetical protein
MASSIVETSPLQRQPDTFANASAWLRWRVWHMFTFDGFHHCIALARLRLCDDRDDTPHDRCVGRYEGGFQVLNMASIRCSWLAARWLYLESAALVIAPFDRRCVMGSRNGNENHLQCTINSIISTNHQTTCQRHPRSQILR